MLNQCAEGQALNENCVIYPSNIGAPVILYAHSGGHEVPRDALLVISNFFKNQALNLPGKSQQNETTSNRSGIAGLWRLKQPSVGESQIQVTEKQASSRWAKSAWQCRRNAGLIRGRPLLAIHWEAHKDLPRVLGAEREQATHQRQWESRFCSLQGH